MNKELQEYTITCNRKQISLIAQALEMNSRMICAQLSESFMPPIRDRIWKAIDEDDNYHEKRKIVEDSFQAIKTALWPELHYGEHYGIGRDDEADLGYEMYKQILSKFEEEHEKECLSEGKTYSGNVHTGTPLKLTKEPVIKIESHE